MVPLVEIAVKKNPGLALLVIGDHPLNLLEICWNNYFKNIYIYNWYNVGTVLLPLTYGILWRSWGWFMPLSLPHDVGHCWATQTVPILGPQDFDYADGIYHYAFWDCFCWQQPTIFRDLRDAGNWSKWGAATKKLSTRKSSRFAIYECFLYLETANSGFPFFVFSRICSSDFFTSGNEQCSSDIAHCKILNTTFGAMIIGCLSREATLMTYLLYHRYRNHFLVTSLQQSHNFEQTNLSLSNFTDFPIRTNNSANIQLTMILPISPE